MVGSVAVELRLPADMRVHSTFHVSLIRPYRTPESEMSDADPVPGPVAWLPDKQPLYTVERVLDYRSRRVRSGKRFRNVHEWFVKWAGYSSEHNSWFPGSGGGSSESQAGSRDAATRGGIVVVSRF